MSDKRLIDCLRKSRKADKQAADVWANAPWEVRRFLPGLWIDGGRICISENGDSGTEDEIMAVAMWLVDQLGGGDE